MIEDEDNELPMANQFAGTIAGRLGLETIIIQLTFES